MSAIAAGGASPPGVVAIRRSLPRLITQIVRDPLSAIPPAAFEARMVLTRNMGRRRAYISDPALIQDVLVRNAGRLGKGAEMKQVLGAALGDGLLTADGATWRWQRQALAGAFQHDKLTQMLPAMIAAAETTRDRLLAADGALVDIGREMMRTTFAIVLETMLSGTDGIDVAKVERSTADFLAATSWMFALAILRLPRWVPFPGRSRAAVAARFMRGTVTKRIAMRRQAGGGADDLVDKLLAARDPETGRALTDDGIADNILTFIVAGHETTALALSWTLALLSDREDCVDRLHAEIEAVTGGGPLLARHVPELGYARQVVSEAMRLYPPAPILSRAVTQNLDVAGVALPPGSLILIPIYALHRHRALWADPDAFDPERFAPEAVRERHRFAFLPFGAGPRVCIGSAFALLEAVAILAVLVKSLRFERAGPMPRPLMRVTLRPERPLIMRVCARRPERGVAADLKREVRPARSGRPAEGERAR